MENKDRHLIGKQLGTCTLEQLIGVGGMGMVYLAQQLRPTRTVAVKVLRIGGGPTSNEHQEFLTRFRREADVIARLDHINILPVYEYGEQDGLAYLVMPHLTGGNLRDALAKNGPLPLPQALIYIEQIAAALQYAHEHRVVHRDIKPANMLFHADGRLVLADFGIARIMREEGERVEETLTGPSHFLGSVEYMAPEMVNGKQVDHRTDIYELGIVLFQMLAGRVPFQGTTPFMIAAQHINELPPSLSLFMPTIPPAVDAVVRKALAKKPDDRYRSATEMAQALRTAINPPANVVKETYSTYISPHQGPPVVNEHALAQEAFPEMYRPGVPELPSPQRDQVSTGKGSGSTPYHGNAIYTTGPHKPPVLYDPSPQALVNRRSRWPIWTVPVCILVILVIGSLLLGLQILRVSAEKISSPSSITQSVSHAGLPSPGTSTSKLTNVLQPTQTQTPQQQVQSVVQSYYDAINESRYQDAYQLWSNDYQQAHPYEQFTSGFTGTKHDDIIFHNITQNADGKYQVAMTLYATENTTSGIQVSAFAGSYVLEMVNGTWKLLSANFQPIGTSQVPTTPAPGQAQAQGVVQSYYDAINRADYQNAYQLWGTDYQSTHPYDQFANGFATTQHDNITFGTTTQLADGVFRVEATITATNKTNTGTVTNIYKGSYIIGQENGVTKLLTANFQQVN